MAGRLAGKVALVVGAGSIGPGWGNGKATAVLFAREGAKVLCMDRDLKAAEETVRIVAAEGGSAAAHKADVTDPSEVEGAVAACIGRYGRIDVLQSNVGIVSLGGPVDLPVEEWDRVHDINLRGPLLAAKYAIPHMLKQGGGAMVFISSVAAIRWTGIPYISYMTSKAAMLQLAQGIALQYARQGIRANCVLPGLMDTPMIRVGLPDVYAKGDAEEMVKKRDAQCPTGKMGTAWDVAHASLFLASDDARYVTGQALVVDGGLTAKFA